MHIVQFLLKNRYLLFESFLTVQLFIGFRLGLLCVLADL